MTNPIEVVASWDANPLETTLHTQPTPLCIGPSAGAWFSLPEALLEADHELLVPQNGGWLLVVPEGADVRVAKDGQLVETTGRHVALEAGTSAEVRIGDFAFFVRPTAAVVDTTPRTSRRYGWLRWMGVAALLHALVLGIFAMSPPNVAALNAGDRPDPTRYISVSVDALAQRPEEPTPMSTPAQGDPGAPGGEPGGPTPSDRIAESSTPAPRRPGRRPSPTMSFSPLTSDDLNDIGPLAVIRAMSWSDDDDSPFTAGNDREGDGGLGEAARLLTHPGRNLGPLGPTGPGRGTCNPAVEDCTAGMIHTGPLTTHGHGPNPGWHPHRTPGRTPMPPQPGPTTTNGSLSREQVRRTVQRHLNEVRFCYEQGLQSRPDLEGRVAVSFVITSTGVVQAANVASDSTGSNQVSSCVSTAVRRWTFPSSEGATGVTYPFLFQSNG